MALQSFLEIYSSFV